MTAGPRYSYTWTPASPTVPRVTTSRTELTHIGIAYVVLTVDLTVIFFGGGLLFGGAGISALLSGLAVGVAAVAALTGFVCHELAHKVYAQRHGFWAEFRMSPIGLVFSLFSAFLGFLWAAPGATVIGGMSVIDRENWGRTSLAGPLSNLGFAAVFYAGAVVTFAVGSWFYFYFVLLAWTNAWFATFNLVPLGPLDGAKVFHWRKDTWVGALVIAGAFTVLLYLMLYQVTTPLLGH